MLPATCPTLLIVTHLCPIRTLASEDLPPRVVHDGEAGHRVGHRGKGKGEARLVPGGPGPGAERGYEAGPAAGDGEGRDGERDGRRRRGSAACDCEVWRLRVRARVDGRGGSTHQYCNCMHSSWLRAPAKPVCVDNGRAGVDGAARYVIRPRAMRGRRVNGWGGGVWGPSWCNGWVSWAAGGLGTNERWAASEVDWIGVVD